MVGIDVEWQPSFDAQLAKAAVLQIATHNQVFLLDVFSLREEKDCTAAQGQQLIRLIFGNPHILKLGFGMKEDLQVLSRSLPGLEDISKSFVNWIDMKNLWTHIETRYPSFVPTTGEICEFSFVQFLAIFRISIIERLGCHVHLHCQYISYYFYLLFFLFSDE